MRVSPELIEASTGTTRWQQPFDRDVSGVFEMQAEIASSVAQALNVALAGNDRANLAEKPTTDMAAYDAFLRGEGRHRVSPSEIQCCFGARWWITSRR